MGHEGVVSLDGYHLFIIRGTQEKHSVGGHIGPTLEVIKTITFIHIKYIVYIVI